MTAVSRVDVAIATRNRPESLIRCVRSLALLGDMLAAAIVVDDGSAPPVEPVLRAALDRAMNDRLTVVRHERSLGTAASRNRCVAEAGAAFVLLVDDDTVILTRDAIAAAAEVLDRDASVFAVGFAQAYADGTPLAPGAQAAPSDTPCETAAYIGFAHLVRRELFVRLGGYQNLLMIHGEEAELCVRALDAGYRVVYLPGARVAHLADPSGRDMRRYLHLTVRNGVLASILDDPLAIVLVRVPLRLRAYFAMRRGWQVHDPGGWWVIARWIVRDLPTALARRRAIRWATFRRWRALTRTQPPYEIPT